MSTFSRAGGVGVLWYRREDYPRLLQIMTDAAELAPTFNEWQRRANVAVALIRRKNGQPIQVEAGLEEIVAYCTARGLKLNAEGRNIFAADPANWPPGS